MKTRLICWLVVLGGCYTPTPDNIAWECQVDRVAFGTTQMVEGGGIAVQGYGLADVSTTDRRTTLLYCTDGAIRTFSFLVDVPGKCVRAYADHAPHPAYQRAINRLYLCSEPAPIVYR